MTRTKPVERYARAGPRTRRAVHSLDASAGWALVIATALNLNGVFNMVFDVGQAMSLIMFTASLYLIIRIGKTALSGLMALFIATIAAYLGFGALFTQTDDSLRTILEYTQTYTGTLLITWAIAASYVAAARRGQGHEYLCLVRNSFVVSAASVWASPFLYTFYVTAPASMADRMSGFFGNPNEAGAAAAAGLALVLGQPYRSRTLTLAAIIICMTAIVLTFSKTALGIGIVIFALAALRVYRGLARLLALTTMLLMFLIVQNPRDIFDKLAEQTVVELSGEQQKRVRQLGDLLSGDLTFETTTGRTEMSSLGIERIMESPLAGQGLGSYHYLVGGYLENGVWQGVHNTFLMLWGEAGLLAVLLFTAFCLLYTKRLFTGRCLNFEMSLALLVLAVLMTGHNSLALRFVNLMMGLLIGMRTVSQHQNAMPGNDATRGRQLPPRVRS